MSLEIEYLNSGIYGILNIVNDKLYLGSAVNLKRRWAQHVSDLKYNKHDNNYLQKSWNKHGQENFIFIVLEFCLNVELTCKEQWWIDKLEVYNRDIGYNIRRDAKSNLGLKYPDSHREKCRINNTGKKHSEETKAKMRKVKRSDEFKQNVSLNRRGKKPSNETIEKIRRSNIETWKRKKQNDWTSTWQ